PAHATPRDRTCAPAHPEPSSPAASADATRPPWSSTFAASRDSPGIPPWPGVRRPAWARNPHNAGVGAPESCARTGPPTCGSMAGLVVHELGHHPRARECGAASAAPGGRLLSTAWLQLPASDAFALPRATLSIGPVLVGSRRCAPFPWGPRPTMKADISTLHKPDILILRRHSSPCPLCPQCSLCTFLIFFPYLFTS